MTTTAVADDGDKPITVVIEIDGREIVRSIGRISREDGPLRLRRPRGDQ